MTDTETKVFHKWTQKRMLEGKPCLVNKGQFCLEAFIDVQDPVCVKCWKENREK